MSIEKRKLLNGNVKYRVRIVNKGKIIKASTFTKRADAEKWENEQKVQYEREKYFPMPFTDISFNELFETWLLNHAEIKNAASKVKRDKQMYRDYINPFIGKEKAHLITPTEIDMIIQKLIGLNKLSNKTINMVLALVRTIFNYGIKKRHLVYNPVSSVDFLPVNPIEFSYWTNDEVYRFLSHTNQKYKDYRSPYVLYLTALTTGVRAGELNALKWDAINLDKRLISVKRTYDRALNSIKDTTKGKKIRYVGIGDELFSELVKIKNSSKLSDTVFVNTDFNAIDHSNFRNRHFDKDISESRVTAIRFHDLRHTFASHYMMNGGNLYDLQKILGHSDVKTTMRYAHLAPDHIAHTANIVNFGRHNENLSKISFIK